MSHGNIRTRQKSSGWYERFRKLIATHLAPTLKFLTVGGLVFFVDAAIYNALVFWDPSVEDGILGNIGLGGWGRGVLFSQPLTAKIIAISFASILTYIGNRLWTFRDRGARTTPRSLAAFVLVNIIATLLQLACLGFSRYVLGFDSQLADNISGTIIGQLISTSFRYITYGRYVFTPGAILPGERHAHAHQHESEPPVSVGTSHHLPFANPDQMGHHEYVHQTRAGIEPDRPAR
ncbi:GtrA family protein [Devriesea agamarum]|uniref:GtrA family protein n=1 Tax=Devriesea agamarum TaxID=472569 RepID=UPI000A01FA69|nr:GtrA family protein [Devriesea agamarum]